jgi:hypothetical protein
MTMIIMIMIIIVVVIVTTIIIIIIIIVIIVIIIVIIAFNINIIIIFVSLFVRAFYSTLSLTLDKDSFSYTVLRTMHIGKLYSFLKLLSFKGILVELNDDIFGAPAMALYTVYTALTPSASKIFML